VNNWGTVIVGWAVSGVGIGVYVVWLLRRGRYLGNELGIGSADQTVDPTSEDG
jgi:hypothetical protein